MHRVPARATVGVFLNNNCLAPDWIPHSNFLLLLVSKYIGSGFMDTLERVLDSNGAIKRIYSKLQCELEVNPNIEIVPSSERG